MPSCKGSVKMRIQEIKTNFDIPHTKNYFLIQPDHSETPDRIFLFFGDKCELDHILDINKDLISNCEKGKILDAVARVFTKHPKTAVAPDHNQSQGKSDTPTDDLQPVKKALTQSISGREMRSKYGYRIRYSADESVAYYYCFFPATISVGDDKESYHIEETACEPIGDAKHFDPSSTLTSVTTDQLCEFIATKFELEFQDEQRPKPVVQITVTLDGIFNTPPFRQQLTKELINECGKLHLREEPLLEKADEKADEHSTDTQPTTLFDQTTPPSQDAASETSTTHLKPHQ